MSGVFKHGKLTIAGLLIVGMITGGLFVSTFDFGGATSNHVSFVPSVSAKARSLKEISDTFASVAEKVTPAVVLIRSQGTVEPQNQQGRGDPFEDFFGPFFDVPRQPQRGLGSGVIVSKDGYILTNNHVVDGADKIKVILPDERKFDAKLIGRDPNTDLAVIKVEGDDFPILTFGDSDELRVGEWVMAIGNPAGLTHTVTAGIVSAKGRSGILEPQSSYEDFIQTDAAINPGNSGGALVDLDGHLMGINTAIVGRGYQGLGFAIPSNMARDIMTRLIEDGRIIRGYLGIFIQDLTQEMADALGLKDTDGVLVSSIQEGGPASDSDLRKGDVVVALNGEPFENSDEFRKRVARMRPGTQVRLDVIRNNDRKTVTVKLGELPSTVQTAVHTESGDVESRLGISVQDVTRDIARRFGYEPNEGVIVSNVKPGSVADDAGVRRGDLIKQINRQSVSSLQDFTRIMREFEPGDAMMFLIRRGNQGEFFIGLRVPRQ